MIEDDQTAMPFLLDTLVRRQAEAAPNAPAVFDARCMLTYGELVVLAARLANRLRAAGAKPEMRVGLCCERSSTMIVAILGILFSGAAYVPLDPLYPPERLAFMLEDSAVSILVADRAALRNISRYTGTVIYLDETGAGPELGCDTAGRSGSDLAYTIYTSGSTGRPKGVMIEHRSIVAFARWTRQYFQTEQTHRVLCANSLSFDVSVFEIFAALVAGGAVVVMDNILRLLGEPPPEPVTMLFAAPSSLAEIARAKKIPASVHTIVTGGERLNRSLAREIYRVSYVELLLNTWGVTEDTICSTVYPVPKHLLGDPPIGVAVGERAISLLAADGTPVAPGTPGEMTCAGSGVARGYTGRDPSGGMRFAPDPSDPRRKIYRTGDLAVMEADGRLRFLGREDGQVKIQGMRIELGEIEAALQRYPGVRQAAIVVRAGSNVLDLYAVESLPGALDLTEIRRALGRKLPAYMLPDTLTVLHRMPMTSSGKLDRLALQKRYRTDAGAAPGYEAPADRYEEAVAALFARLLGLERVSVLDNFFAIGGRSLVAARVGTEIAHLFANEVATLRERSGKNALESAFVAQPTARYLARVLQGLERPVEGRKPLVCLQEGSAGRTPLFLFHGVINGEAFYSLTLMHKLGKEQPVYTLAPHGVDGIDVPNSVEEMAADYLARIREIQPYGPYHFIGYCNGGLVAYEIARMLQAQGETLETLVLVACPGHNIRFRRLKNGFDALRFVPGMNAKIRLRLFNRSRDVLRLAKHQLKYVVNCVRASFRRRDLKARSALERLRIARRVARRIRTDDMRFVNIINAIDDYVPGPYVGRVCLLWGRDDEYLRNFNPERDWAAAVSELHCEFVEGGHMFLDTHPEVILEHFPHRP